MQFAVDCGLHVIYVYTSCIICDTTFNFIDNVMIKFDYTNHLTKRHVN